MKVWIMLSGPLFIALVLLGTLSHAFSVDCTTCHRRPSKTVLSMGWIDSVSNFLQSRDGDFIKLKETERYGPGPAIILYKVPQEIDDEEVLDILHDEARLAHRTGVRLVRINHGKNNLLACSVEKALSQVMDLNNTAATAATGSNFAAPDDDIFRSDRCPVLFFSGFDNREMMAAYNVLASQIYQETGASAACAKAVPNAMEKSLKQVLEEIAGDHSEAMSKE